MKHEMSEYEKGISEQEIDEVMKLLDAMTDLGVGRIKVQTSEEVNAGQIKNTYHHGRCDIGSPWACGTAFDVLEDGE